MVGLLGSPSRVPQPTRRGAPATKDTPRPANRQDLGLGAPAPPEPLFVERCLGICDEWTAGSRRPGSPPRRPLSHRPADVLSTDCECPALTPAASQSPKDERTARRVSRLANFGSPAPMRQAPTLSTTRATPLEPLGCLHGSNSLNVARLDPACFPTRGRETTGRPGSGLGRSRARRGGERTNLRASAHS